MTHINPRVLAHIAANNGLITAWQAADLGMSRTWINHQVRQRLWIALHRGVYVDAEIWDSLDPHHAQPWLRARAILLLMKRDAVPSHDSAAHALQLDYLEPDKPIPHFTRPGVTHAWRSETHAVHLARFTDEDVEEVDGVRVLGRARTVIDIAREHGLLAGMVAGDSAMRGGLPRSALWNVVDGMANWRNVSICRSTAELSSPFSQSMIEVLGRHFVTELGICPVADIDLQWPFQRPDGRIAWADIRVGRHIFETHGKIKVLPPELGGVAKKSAADVLWDTRKRERQATTEGLGVSNLYWDDFFGAQRRTALGRARAEVDQTVQRYGDNVLPEHLARNAREIRARMDRPGAM